MRGPNEPCLNDTQLVLIQIGKSTCVQISANAKYRDWANDKRQAYDRRPELHAVLCPWMHKTT